MDANILFLRMQKTDAVVTWMLTFGFSVCKKIKWMQWSHAKNGWSGHMGANILFFRMQKIKMDAVVTWI